MLSEPRVRGATSIIAISLLVTVLCCLKKRAQQRVQPPADSNEYGRVDTLEDENSDEGGGNADVDCDHFHSPSHNSEDDSSRSSMLQHEEAQEQMEIELSELQSVQDEPAGD